MAHSSPANHALYFLTGCRNRAWPFVVAVKTQADPPVSGSTPQP
jgi:hypothetical protein